MSRKLHIEVFRYNPLDPASVPHMQSFYVEEYSSNIFPPQASW